MSKTRSEDDGRLEQLITVRDWLRYAVSRFNQASVCSGHGLAEAYDEAAYLVLHTLRLPPDRLDLFLDARLLPAERSAVAEVVRRRVDERIPAAYLTREAFLGEFRFYVDERVIVPRSYFAELLDDALSPWIADPLVVSSALDLCTGSGCLAVIMAHVFPHAHIDATDISIAALEVARRNVAEYGLDDRISLEQSNLFGELAGRRYDLIVSNPPYVTAEAMASLPAEYQHEPKLALAAGEDGLDYVRRILNESRRYLRDSGILVVEVGYNRPIVEKHFPRLPFIWLTSRTSEGAVFLLHADELPAT